MVVLPYYIYLTKDTNRVLEAQNNSCGYDALDSLAAWLSHHTNMHRATVSRDNDRWLKARFNKSYIL